MPTDQLVTPLAWQAKEIDKTKRPTSGASSRSAADAHTVRLNRIMKLFTILRIFVLAFSVIWIGFTGCAKVSLNHDVSRDEATISSILAEVNARLDDGEIIESISEPKWEDGNQDLPAGRYVTVRTVRTVGVPRIFLLKETNGLWTVHDIRSTVRPMRY
jgi:hypothetical protein